MVIGITGPIGHGKTTFADALAQREPSFCHLEANMAIIEVANALHKVLPKDIDPTKIDSINTWLQSLPDILQRVVGVTCSFEQIALSAQAVQDQPAEYQKLMLHIENLQHNPVLAQQDITADNKTSYRPFLQWLGGYLVARVDPGIWFNEVVRRLRQSQQAGCKVCIVGGVRYPSDAAILRTANAKIIKLYRPGYLQTDTLDPTERERDSIQADSTIISNGSVEDLQRCAAQILQDIQADKLQQTYQTKEA